MFIQLMVLIVGRPSLGKTRTSDEVTVAVKQHVDVSLIRMLTYIVYHSIRFFSNEAMIG